MENITKGVTEVTEYRLDHNIFMDGLFIELKEVKTGRFFTGQIIETGDTEMEVYLDKDNNITITAFSLVMRVHELISVSPEIDYLGDESFSKDDIQVFRALINKERGELRRNEEVMPHEQFRKYISKLERLGRKLDEVLNEGADF